MGKKVKQAAKGWSGLATKAGATARHDANGELRRPKGAKRERRCVNAHDRCYGGAGSLCPYCE